MIGIDTNVLVRYLTNDDEDQGRRARAAIDGFTPDEPGFVSLVTLVETLWLLRSTFKVSREDLLRTVTALVASDRIHLQDEPAVDAAIALARQANCDLPDALVATLGSACHHTWTFDRRAARLPGMKLL